MLPNLYNYDCIFSLVVPLIIIAFLKNWNYISGFLYSNYQFLTLTPVFPSKNYEFWASII